MCGSAATTTSPTSGAAGRSGLRLSSVAASTSTASSSTTARASRSSGREGSPWSSPPRRRRRRRLCSRRVFFRRGGGCCRSRGSGRRGLRSLLLRGLLLLRRRVRALVRGAARARTVQVAVPAAAFELEGVAAHDLRHLGAALGTRIRRRIGQLLQALLDPAARLADELVDRHSARISANSRKRRAFLRPKDQRENNSRKTR